MNLKNVQFQISVILLGLLSVPWVLAQESYRNPFEDQLPKIVEDPIVEPVITEPDEADYDPVPIVWDFPEPEPVSEPESIPEPKIITNQNMVQAASVPALPKLEISGIVWQSEKPQAIVNNQVVTIGDIVDNVEVVDIIKEGIEVKFLGQLHFVEP